MKVLFIANIPSPYRVAFLNKLGELCDLTVLFERKKAKGRSSDWFEEKGTKYNQIFLKTIKYGEDKKIGRASCRERV